MKLRTCVRTFVKLQSTLTKSDRVSSTGLTLQELSQNPSAAPAPNRNQTWTTSQEARVDVISKNPHRFVQKDLDVQPRPYAAIDLISKEPIKYLHEGNIAVCDGNKGSTLQGHPKVYINLDQPKASTCGYCGLRYAKEEYKNAIESESI